MISSRVYFPIKELADPGQLPLGDLLDDVFEHIWLTSLHYDWDRQEGVVGVFVDADITAKMPSVAAATLSLAVAQDGLEFDIRARFKPTPSFGVELPLTLRINADVIRPLKENTNEPDLSKKTFDIELGKVTIAFNIDGDLSLNIPMGLSIPRCMVGNTGVILQIGKLSWVTPSTKESERPPNTPPGFTGLFFDDVTVELPRLSIPVGTLRMDDVFIGTGGFSGRVSWADTSLRWNGQAAGFSGLAVTDIFGFKGGLSKVELAFKQSALTECILEGNIFAPYIERVIGLSLGFDGNGALTAIAQTPTCQFSNPKDAAAAGPSGYLITADTDAFTLDISRIELHAGGSTPASLSLAGRAKLKVSDFGLPGVVFKGLQIDTQGHVAVEGGWLDVDTARSSALSGFPFQITKIGFGAEKDGSRWIGLNGGIKLAEGLPVGASVEGLRVSWKPKPTGGVDVSFSLEGIGLELSVPGTFSFAGKVAFFKKDGSSGFRGTLKLSLDSLKMTVDAGFMIGRTDDGTTFFYFFLDIDLPAGIPLFSTGAALYGFAGLLAVHLNPDRAEGEDWYYGYYRRPERGVTDPAKWKVERGGFALGVGTTIGTLPDTGFSISAKVLLILVLPGPRLLLQGKGKFISKKPEQKDPSAEGTFEALLVLDIPAKLFQANLAVALKISNFVEISGGLSAAFSWAPSPPPDLWHVYVGEKTPADRRIHATVFKLLQADSWLMINPPGALRKFPPGHDRVGDFEMGGSIGVSFDFDFTVAKAWLRASINGAAAISWDPQQFTGSLALRGSAGISAMGASIVADLVAEALIKAPSPWYLYLNVEVQIKIDLLIDKWEFKAKLPLEFGNQNLPLPEPVMGHVALSADHDRADEAKPLPAVVPPDFRPLMIFKRPTQDRARFGAPGLPEFDPEDLGVRQVSYQLHHVVLTKGDLGTPLCVGAAGEVEVRGTSLTFIGMDTVNGFPDLAGSEITLFGLGVPVSGSFTISSGGGSTATLVGNAPQGTLSYRLTGKRATTSVEITQIGDANTGEVLLNVSGPIVDPHLFRGGSLVIGGVRWLILEATERTIRVRIADLLPTTGPATLRGPDPSTLEGKWMPSGDPVTSSDSSTRLQLWARTPYSFFRHNEESAIDGLDAFRPDYACGAQPEEDPICSRFGDVTLGPLEGSFSTAGITAGAHSAIVEPTQRDSENRIMLGGNMGGEPGTVWFYFDPPVDAVWITAAHREAGWIATYRGDVELEKVRMQSERTRYRFTGEIGAVIIQGAPVAVYELCFTPGWTCRRFHSDNFPNERSSEIGYAGITLMSNGVMRVDADHILQVALPSDAISPRVIEESFPIRLLSIKFGQAEISGQPIKAEFVRIPISADEPITLAIRGLIEPVLTELPSLGIVQLLPGFAPAMPLPTRQKGRLSPSGLVAVEPQGRRGNTADRKFGAPTAHVWTQGHLEQLASLTILFPNPATRVRVRLASSAEVIAFAGTQEVGRASGDENTPVSIHVSPSAPAQIGWFDRVVILAPSQVRVSEVCSDAGDFGWKRYQQWEWSQSVQRSIETLYQTGPVLSPGSYELRVYTAAVVTGASPVTQSEVTRATFRVGQPPGFPTSPAPVDPAGRYPDAGPLTDLSTYVERTLPPAGTRLWYRGYDTAVGFNENYVTRLYLEAGHELSVTVVNASGVAIRSSVRHVWSGSDVGLDAWTVRYVRTLNGDGTDRCAAIDLSRVVRPEQVIASGEPLEPARLHASELRASGSSPHTVHRFEFTTSEYVSFRHHLAMFDGHCRRRKPDTSAIAASVSPRLLADRFAQNLNGVAAATTAATNAKATANKGTATEAELDAVKLTLEALKQARVQLSEQSNNAFTGIWESCFGSQHFELPSTLELSAVAAKTKDTTVTDVLLLESPEPIAWSRVNVSASMTIAHPLMKTEQRFTPAFGRPDKGFDVEYGGVRWLAGVELWVIDGALRARADEPLRVIVFCDSAASVDLTIRVDAGGQATVTTHPPGDAPIVLGPSTAPHTITLEGQKLASIMVEGRGVGIESFSITKPFIPTLPQGLVRITDVRLPTNSQSLDHEITLMAIQEHTLEGFTVRWIDALAPKPSELYATVKPIHLKAGQRLRLIPGRSSVTPIDDALVQVGGGGSTMPPPTGATYQLIDSTGLVVHECAAMPATQSINSLVPMPNSDGTRAFLVPTTTTQAISPGHWTISMTLVGEAGPDLDRWSVGGVPVTEIATLRFSPVPTQQDETNLTAFPAEVLADRPAAYYRLNEPSGSPTLRDSSGNNNHSVLVRDGVVLGVPGLGLGDTAAQFNGVMGRIVIPNSEVLNPPRITMEALVRWDGPTAIEQQRILEKQSFVGIPQYGLNIKSDGHVFVELRRKTSDIQDATSERLVELGTATHIVATYDGFAIQIYINGTLDKTQPIVPPEVDLDIKWPDDLLEVSLVIGDRYDSRPLEHRTFNGLIDEVAIYSQALSPDRIRAHAMAAFPK